MLRPCRRDWWGLLPAAVLLLRWYVPHPIANEAGKLIEARRLLDATFLAHDWLRQHAAEDSLYSLYSLLVAPLWALTGEATRVVLLGRPLIWAATLYALLRLARALPISCGALAFGLAVWLARCQSLGAGEWVLGGMEAKCLAYAAVFVAVENLLRRRLGWATAACWLALALHPLVGGWATLAAVGAVLAGREVGPGRRRFVGLNSLALLALALAYGWGQLHGTNAAADRLVVLLRNPQHLDPGYFHGLREFFWLTVLTAASFWALRRRVAREKAVLLSVFLLLLWGEFASGLLAWRLDAFWYLKSYPFRVCDTLVGLFFWLTVPPALGHWLANRGVWRKLAAPVVGGTLLLIVLLGGGGLAIARRHLAEFVSDWRLYLAGEPGDEARLARWLRQTTPRDATLLAPPWLSALPLLAERATVVEFKRAPHDAGIVEWQQRMEALNGGALAGRGEGLEDELRRHYAQIRATQAASLGRQYGARYFLALRPLPDAATRPVFQVGTYFVYDLQR